MSLQERGMFWHPEAPSHDPVLGAGNLGYAIGIPARDEADLVAACLRSLAAQSGAPPFAVALVLNNCRDGTAEVVRAVAPELPYPLHVFEVELPSEFADAAWARRLATNAALGLVQGDGLVLTTDADSRADADWVRNIAACFDAGADLVCGFVAPDFNDAPPLSFEAIRRGALEFEYGQLTAEIAALLDPDPIDPWPNHLVETGANLAIRARALAALGGVPHVCPGEDRRLVEMARRAGYRIRHAFPPSVTTSSRVRGRAEGGWSDDLQARLSDDRAACHPRLEPASVTMHRVQSRARLRKAYGSEHFPDLVAQFVSDPVTQRGILEATPFEEAWALLEAANPDLATTPLLASALEESVAQLRDHVAAARAASDAEREATQRLDAK